MRVRPFLVVVAVSFGIPFAAGASNSRRAPTALSASAPQEGGAGKKEAPTRSVDLTFIDRSGTILERRTVELQLGNTETISVSQGGRSISAKTTIRRASKAGCHRVDIVLRDGTIDSTGHIKTTVWRSGSQACGSLPLTLGPKAETKIELVIAPLQ